MFAEILQRQPAAVEPLQFQKVAVADLVRQRLPPHGTQSGDRRRDDGFTVQRLDVFHQPADRAGLGLGVPVEKYEHVAAGVPRAEILGGRRPRALLVPDDANLRELLLCRVDRAVPGGVVGYDDLVVQPRARLDAGGDCFPKAVALVVGGNDEADPHRGPPGRAVRDGYVTACVRRVCSFRSG
jgi:hypothetical protein